MLDVEVVSILIDFRSVSGTYVPDARRPGGTYAQAQMAYYVAYQQYSKSAQSVQSKWSDFANGLYGKANLQIWGLYVG